MKKFLAIALAFLALSLILCACGKTEKQPTADATISFEDGNGIKTDVNVNVFSNFSNLSISCREVENTAVIDSISSLRESISEKTGAAVYVLSLDEAVGEDIPEIIIRKNSEDLGESDFKIAYENNKIDIIGGSDDALINAIALFDKYFVYKANKSILVPADGSYTYEKNYYFEKIDIDGTDISEFAIYSEGEGTSIEDVNPCTIEMANKLSELFATDLVGYSLPVTTDKNRENLIVIEAHGTDVDGYSVEIRDGNIYILGSKMSINNAFEAFVSDVLGFDANAPKTGAELVLSSENNVSGEIGFEVPYTKEQLLALFEEVSDSEEMVISGTHTESEAAGNMSILDCSDELYEVSGHRPAFIEIDMGRRSIYYNRENKELIGKVITPYDLSVNVAEAATHVSGGGIIGLSMHFSNPLMNDAGNTWYRGYLGGEEKARELITEGTELNAMFRETIQSTLLLAKALDDNGIPFLFRPFHEMNGNWFWWCSNQMDGQTLSQEFMHDLWIYFYNIVTVEMGIKNAIWVYSPNYQYNGIHDVMYAYPGDEYVDIVGVDWYTNGNYEVNTNNGYTKLMETGKPAALCEFGPNSGSSFAVKDENGETFYTWTCEDLLDTILQMIDDGFEVSYFLTWWGASSIARLDGAEILMNNPFILSQEDLAEYWKGLK